MAPQLAAVRDSRAKQVGRWLRDRVYPTLDPPARNLLGDAEKPKREINADANDDVVREVYGHLSAELESETERRRAVETKLLAIGSVAPIAVTIMVAAASFLSSGRLRDLVPVSVIVISVMVYVALQFLCAMRAAICGLSRKNYDVPHISDIVPNSTERLSWYLRNASNNMARRIEQHRETTNTKVSQLAVAHQAMRNAVTALVVALFIFLIPVGLIVWELVWDSLT